MRVKTVTSKRLHNNNRMQFEQNVRKVNNTVTEYDHGDNHSTRDTSLWWELKRQYRLMTITCSVAILNVTHHNAVFTPFPLLQSQRCSILRCMEI